MAHHQYVINVNVNDVKPSSSGASVPSRAHVSLKASTSKSAALMTCDSADASLVSHPWTFRLSTDRSLLGDRIAPGAARPQHP